MGERIRIAKNPLFVEGNRDASFIQIPGPLSISVVYALLNRPTSVNHTDIFNEAIEMGYISGNIEPNGGGVIDYNTCEFRGASIHYGPPDDQVLDKFIHHLHRC